MSVFLKKYPFTNILGWSVSRYEKFKACPRQYFYDYYAKYHDNEFEKEFLNKLKGLTTIPLETGNITHDIIKNILQRLTKSSNPLDIEKLKSYSNDLTIRYCRSKEFAEIFYNELDSIDIESIKQKVERYVLNLIESERYRWISEDAIEESGNWLIEPDGYGETRINDLKAYCKVDFLFPLGDKINIVDWKTGNENEVKHRKQMLGYTAFACNHFDKRPDEITCIVYYLKTGKETIMNFSDDDISEFGEAIRLESEEMYEMTVNKDNNIPKDKLHFAKTEDVRVCRNCNYRKLCFPKGIQF